MLNDKLPEDLQEKLTESFGDVNAILKALGTSQRQKILISLLDAPKTFHELKDQVDLGRTALSNHLAILKGASLIGKIHHGYYRITQKGQDFLQAICIAYEHSLTEEAKQKEAEQKKFLMDTFLQRKTK
ncbi:MAG: winged helix-turn-helix transcriptional regulator [Asgard group archaeon]|nr:winged helix-turn-helix transcriptional regulator [Asgard group archaeon]